MKKQLLQLFTLAMFISTSCLHTAASSRYQKRAAALTGQTVVPSEPAPRRAPSPAPVSTPPSMPAPTASAGGPVTVAELKAMAASNPNDVAAGLAQGLMDKYSGNVKSAAGQAAYNFVTNA